MELARLLSLWLPASLFCRIIECWVGKDSESPFCPQGKSETLKPFLTAYLSNLFLWRLHSLPRWSYWCLESFAHVFVNLLLLQCSCPVSPWTLRTVYCLSLCNNHGYLRPLAYLLIFCPSCITYTFILSFIFALQDMQSGCFIEFTISSVTPHCVKDLDKEFAHRLLARAGINLHQPRNRPRIKFLLFYPPGCLMASVRK